MPADSHDTNRPPERPDRESTTTTDDTKLVVEFSIPAGGFVLRHALESVPDRIVEFEQFVPTHEQVLPYLWVTDADDDGSFGEAVATDPTVESHRRVATLDGGKLYRIDWADCENTLLWWLRNRPSTMLQSEGHDGEWNVKLRVESRDALRDFQDYCRDRDLSFDLIRLYELTEPKLGQFNVSEKQREILIAALEMGYFEIPRGATLEEVADAVGISKRAASERLRRGHTNLVNNTLTIGRPSGVGVGTDPP